MSNSLKAKLSKLRHKGQISNAEYEGLIKKLDGHDRVIRNKAIDEFRQCLIDNGTYDYSEEDAYMIDRNSRAVKSEVWRMTEIEAINIINEYKCLFPNAQNEQESLEMAIQALKKQEKIKSVLHKENNEWIGSDYEEAFEIIKRVIMEKE